ncbi:MAG: heme ABC exporter ATP-binding protein CcmA [Rhodospirillales bacterium]
MSLDPQDLFAGENLAVMRGERLLFKQVDFELAAGQVLVLRGANGSGKTTLLRIMAGLTRPLVGDLTWGERPLAELPDFYRRHVAFVGHRPGLKDDLTPRESLCFDARLRGVGPREAEQALESLGLESLAALPAKLLSAGQRRRVALARLALGGAALWLLDEPATALDAASEANLWRLCRDRLAEGARLVIASHGTVPLAGRLTLAVDRNA